MRKLALIQLLLFTSPVGAVTYWIGDGGYKVAQEDLPPSTTSQFWHDDTAYFSTARNETIGIVLEIGNDTTSDMTGISAHISSFTGTSGGIVSVAVSSGNVWNTTTRPIEEFVPASLPIEGVSKITWEQYDQYHGPARWRLPCTEGGGGYCTANGGTTFNDRPDHNKHYFDIMHPAEWFPSGFTVYASSSQPVWFDVYASTNLAAGLYTAYIYVLQSGTTIQTIPVQLTVRDFTLPQVPQFRVMAPLAGADISERMHNIRWPDNAQVDPYLTTRQRFYQMMHRHGVIGIGEDRVTSDTPYDGDVARLNGTLYTVANGYGNARGVGTGITVYSIGTYGAWKSSWGTTCYDIVPHITNWTNYFASNFSDVMAFWYIDDETMVNVETYSTCADTITASDYQVNRFITYSFPTVKDTAPSINMPCTATWMSVSSETWDSANIYFQQGLTPGTTQGWAYNGYAPWTGTAGTEDDGISPTAIIWTDMKKGIAGHFIWEMSYYNNYQGGIGNTNLFHDAHTFGGYVKTATVSSTDGLADTVIYISTDGVHEHAFPGTSWNNSSAVAAMASIVSDINNQYGLRMSQEAGQSIGYISCSNSCAHDMTARIEGNTNVTIGDSATLGRTGWNYGNGDGVWMYPGIDYLYPNDSNGVDTPIASWRLKMLRRGIQDGDYIAMARQANESAANAIIETAVPKVLYEYNCVVPADCSYTYGKRSWSDNPDVWETNRASLAALIPSDGGDPYCGDGICNGSDTCSNCPGDCGACASGGAGTSFSGRFTLQGGGTLR